ncbi:MAG: hypothetical protein DDT34_01912 [Firmicutes bacterium]|nr:hypothetical protein [Bacillota bacterium]
MAEAVEDGFDGAAFEALIRSEWSLPGLDVRAELNRQDALRNGGSISSDPFAADDFSDQQWAIVLAMKKPCIEAVKPGIDPATRRRAIRWIFEIGEKNQSGLDFETSCRSLGARPFVVQALIHHIWYLKSIVLDDPLPYMSRPLNDVLESEALMIGMERGLELARIVWANPTITESELFHAAGFDAGNTEAGRAYSRMLKEGFFGLRADRVYFTSRHPERRHRANADQGRIRGVTWSGSFIGDDE